MNQIQKSTIEEIVNLHNEIAGHLKISLDKAIRIGELLTEQKASLKHGEWLSWIKANLPFSDRTARVYVRCFKNKAILADSATLGSAMKLLAEPDTYLTDECKDCKHWHGDFSSNEDLHDIPEKCKRAWQRIKERHPDVFGNDIILQSNRAIEQEIKEELEKGKTPYSIGKELAARIEKLFKVNLEYITSMEHGKT